MGCKANPKWKLKHSGDHASRAAHMGVSALERSSERLEGMAPLSEEHLVAAAGFDTDDGKDVPQGLKSLRENRQSRVP
jgi:hypothetical protein